MGKHGRARKKARRQKEIGAAGSVDHAVVTTMAAAATASSSANPSTELDEIDVEITESTLRLLLESPDVLLRSPLARTIRTQAYAIVEALGNSKSLSGRVGDALHDGRWADAALFLKQLKEAPPLGALQRWIRDLFESGNADPVTTSNLLYLILRCTGQVAIGDDDGGKQGPVKVFDMWYSFSRNGDSITKTQEEDTWEIPEIEAVAMESSWRDGMTLWSCKSAVLGKSSTTPMRQEVPFVKGGFVMNQVLSPLECRRIIRVAHKMGFTPDASYSLSEAVSPSADGVVWVADDELISELFERVRPLLPQQLYSGKLVGINKRWRIYNYATGAIYRPHIDGAWTGSGMVDGKYVNDIYNGSVTSRLTFLIYLNDNFQNGGTRFYSPAFESGCIAARSVAPVQGSILCFPHGHGVENVGLVHEGSAVTEGSKCVVRSDVLYEVPHHVRP